MNKNKKGGNHKAIIIIITPTIAVVDTRPERKKEEIGSTGFGY